MGGGGAGSAVILSAMSLLLKGRSSNKASLMARELPPRFFSVGYCLSFIILIISIFCLLIELTRPDRFYYVILYPSFSILSVGSFVLAATSLFSGVLGLTLLFKTKGIPLGIQVFLELCCLVLGIATMLYTGIFLMEFKFIVLWNNPILPILFTCSACSVGSALLMLCLLLVKQDAVRIQQFRLLLSVDISAIVLEIVCILGYCVVGFVALAETNAIVSFAEFFFGAHAAEFWIGFFTCGLVIPLCLSVVNRKYQRITLVSLSIPFVLVGGFFLRYCFVNAFLG